MMESKLFYLVVAIGFTLCLTVWNFTPASNTEINFAEFHVNKSKSAPYVYPIDSLPSNDYSHLIDLNNFTFLVLNSVCDDSTVLLIVIHSAPSHFKQRQLIRDTWGKTNKQQSLAFMLGLTDSEQLQREISEESRQHRDVVQGNFKDAYRNLTYKHAMALKYAIYRCPRARYVLKTDDDVFVNTPLMLRLLPRDGARDVLFCVVKRDAGVFRSYRSKWRVSFQEYPYRKYPDYCLGWVVLYSPDVIFALYRTGQSATYFWIDDVYVTGMLAANNSIGHTDVSKYVISPKYSEYLMYYLLRYDFIFGGPDLSEKQIKSMWELAVSRLDPTTVL